MNEQSRRGVMDATYHADRVSVGPVEYRYRVRGRVAVDGFRRFHRDSTFVRVLDMGAADALTLLYMRELLGDGEYVGVEFAQSLIDAAPSMPEDVTLVQGDVMALPPSVAADHFDLACCLAVLEHLDTPERAVNEAFRILKPGGVFVATCPNPFWDRWAGRLRLVEDDFHPSAMTRSALVAVCTNAGFAQVTFEPFMWCVTGILPYLGVQLGASTSLGLDARVRRLRILDWTFANQCVVAVKPGS